MREIMGLVGPYQQTKLPKKASFAENSEELVVPIEDRNKPLSRGKMDNAQGSSTLSLDALQS